MRCEAMGEEWSATCKHCNHEFFIKEGGGFFFHLLRCDKCGKEKTISFDKIGDAHLRYLKGLKGPYCIASSNYDEHIQETYPGDPMTEEEYYKAVESLMRKCRCGGHFTFSSPPRCPKCHSPDIIKGDIFVQYD